jgi:hypothetical protein
MVLMKGDGRLFFNAGRVVCYKFCVFAGVTVMYVAVGVVSTNTSNKQGSVTHVAPSS